MSIRSLGAAPAVVFALSVLASPARAQVAACGVFSTPFIVMDGALEFVGVPREADLRGFSS